MDELLGVDAIALLPSGKAIAARFLAGLLAFDRYPVELAWADEVPEPLASLARARCLGRPAGCRLQAVTDVTPQYGTTHWATREPSIE